MINHWIWGCPNPSRLQTKGPSQKKYLKQQTTWGRCVSTYACDCHLPHPKKAPKWSNCGPWRYRRSILQCMRQGQNMSKLCTLILGNPHMSQGENWVTHKLDVWCSKTTNMTIILKEETMGIEFLTRSAAWECDLRMRFWSVNERTGTHTKEQHGCKWIGLLWLWVQKNTLIHRTKYATVQGYRWQGHPNIPKWPKHTRRSYNLQSFADTLMEHVVMEWLFVLSHGVPTVISCRHDHDLVLKRPGHGDA